MGYDRAGLVQVANGAGFPAVTDRTISYWVRLGLLPKARHLGRGAGGGIGALYEWSEDDLRAFLVLLAKQREVRHLPILAVYPVTSWLYWGDEWTELPQVRRALQTWWTRAGKVTYQVSEQTAVKVAKSVTPKGASRDSRMSLKAAIYEAVDRRIFPREEIIQQLTEARKANPTDGLIGRMGIPPELVVDGMFAMRLAAETIKHDKNTAKSTSAITDEMFEDARRRVNLGGWRYLKQWSEWRALPDIGNEFEIPSIELFFNHACHDVLTDLGMQIMLRERGTPLPPCADVPLLALAGVFREIPAETRTLGAIAT